MADAKRAKVAFGEWLDLSDSQRRARKLPTTQADFARLWGFAPRTVIRWKSDPVVVKSLEQSQKRRGLFPGVMEDVGEEALPPPAEFVGSDSVIPGDPFEAEFEEIRRSLVESAKGGGKGLETYMRYMGQHLLERERAARESSFVDLSDADLVSRVLSLIGRPTVESWLREN